jgi:hypothetical protein
MGGACGVSSSDAYRINNNKDNINGGTNGNGNDRRGSTAEWSRKWQAVNGQATGEAGRFIDSVATIREEEDEVRRLADMTRFTPAAVRRFHQLFVELSAIQYGIAETSALFPITSNDNGNKGDAHTHAHGNGHDGPRRSVMYVHQRTQSRSRRGAPTAAGAGGPSILISAAGSPSPLPSITPRASAVGLGANTTIGGNGGGGAGAEGSSHSTPRALGLGLGHLSARVQPDGRRPSIFATLMEKMQRPKQLDPLPPRPLTPGRITRSLRPEQFCLALGLPASSLLAQVVFNMFDVAQTTRLSFRGFIMTLATLSPHGNFDDKVKLSFGLYDTNKDGLISMDELMAMLKAVVADGALSTILFTSEQMMDMCRMAMRSAKLLARKAAYQQALRENQAAGLLHGTITSRRHADGTPATPVSGCLPIGVEKLKLTGDMPPMFFPTSVVHTPPANSIPLSDEKEPTSLAMEEKTMEYERASRPKVLVTSDSDTIAASGMNGDDDIIISDSTTITVDEYRSLIASSPAFLGAFTLDLTSYLADDRSNGSVAYLPADQPKKKLKKVAKAGKRHHHGAGVATLPPITLPLPTNPTIAAGAALTASTRSPHSLSPRDANIHHQRPPQRFSSSVDGIAVTDDGSLTPAHAHAHGNGNGNGASKDSTTVKNSSNDNNDINTGNDNNNGNGMTTTKGGKQRSISISLSTRTYASFAGARTVGNVDMLMIDDDWQQVPGSMPKPHQH